MVTIAVWLTETEPAAAVKLALVDPDAMVTLAGTVSRPLFVVRLTVAGPGPAARDKVITQFADPPELRFVGEHVSVGSAFGATSETAVACDPPFSDAITETV